MSDKKEKITPEENCKHRFVKYPPKIGKLKVCTKCGFLWAPGGIHSGERTIKLSGSGNYIEASTTTSPASPASGKIRFYATSDTDMKMKNSAGTETDLAATGGDLYNFLTNPGFEIWQRGTGAFTANGAMTADNWAITIIGTDTFSVTKAGAGETDTTRDTGSRYSLKTVFTLGTGAGGSYIQNLLRQNTNLDWSDGLLGRVVSASVRVRANATSAVRVAISTDGTGGIENYSGYHTGGGTFETLTVTNITVPSDATTVRVRLYFAATVTAYFDNATLVIGSTAQTYYPLHPAEEWDRCQRYYILYTPGPLEESRRRYTTARAVPSVPRRPSCSPPAWR